VELDKTRIVVRERGLFDTLDLALHIFRMNFRPLCVTMFMGAFPWAVANYLLIGWMLPADVDFPDSMGQAGYYLRYTWTMAVLVSLQAPLASAFSTVYLGQALFVDRPRLWNAVREVLVMMPRLIWFHGFLRGILPAILLVIIIDRNVPFSGAETLLMLLFLAVMLRRATTPFLNEIILLERNPVGSADPRAMTIRRRVALLHGPAGGIVMGSMILVGLYSVALVVGLAGAVHVWHAVLLGSSDMHKAGPLFVWPLAMWVTAIYTTVARFLGYLDLRIRHEGWEVELRMRAEGHRLAESLQ